MGDTLYYNYDSLEGKVNSEIERYAKKDVKRNTGIENIIENLDSQEFLKGVILSEILGKPLSKRRRKR
jgi:hypothetical protein